MGKTYPRGGVEQGEAVLRDLARKPATATFIATKLARHFVADDPPSSIVERLAAMFRDPTAISAPSPRTLVDSPEPWAAPRAKLKQPEEY